jgi:hypothetical protein
VSALIDFSVTSASGRRYAGYVVGAQMQLRLRLARVLDAVRGHRG